VCERFGVELQLEVHLVGAFVAGEAERSA